MSRSDKRTWRRSEDVVYSDFDVKFEKNPVTGSLIRVTNDDAVKQSVRNIVLTMIGEWAFHPNLGSKVHRLLFDPIDSVTAGMIEDAIEAALRKEDRISVRLIRVVENYALDGYDLTIVYSIYNRIEAVEFNMLLKRVR